MSLLDEDVRGRRWASPASACDRLRWALASQWERGLTNWEDWCCSCPVSRKDRTDVEEVREKSREVSGEGKKQRRKELPEWGYWGAHGPGRKAYPCGDAEMFHVHSLLVFCLGDLSIDVNGVLKTPTIIPLPSISPFRAHTGHFKRYFSMKWIEC